MDVAHSSLSRIAPMEVPSGEEAALSAVECNTSLSFPTAESCSSIFIGASVTAVLNLRSSEMALPGVGGGFTASIMEIKRQYSGKQTEHACYRGGGGGGRESIFEVSVDDKISMISRSRLEFHARSLEGFFLFLFPVFLFSTNFGRELHARKIRLSRETNRGPSVRRLDPRERLSPAKTIRGDNGAASRPTRDSQARYFGSFIKTSNVVVAPV